MASILIPKKPIYLLTCINSTDNQEMEYLEFRFSTLGQISKFLKMANIEHYNLECNLIKTYTEYDDGYLIYNSQGEGEETTLLKDVKAVWYTLNIGDSPTIPNGEVFKFDSIHEIKRFLAKYQSTYQVTKRRYIIRKYTRYFVESQNYRISTDSEVITPEELNDL